MADDNGGGGGSTGVVAILAIFVIIILVALLCFAEDCSAAAHRRLTLTCKRQAGNSKTVSSFSNDEERDLRSSFLVSDPFRAFTIFS